MAELISRVIINPVKTELDGAVISNKGIIGLYREFVGNYPKFFKMDSLCKLGFVAAELLLRDLSAEEKELCSVILFNESGSLITDRYYENTIVDADNYYPSPALFVYTLANIVTGEIAIRHKIYGETSFYVIDKYNESYMETIALNSLTTSNPTKMLYGWVDYKDENDYFADLKLININK